MERNNILKRLLLPLACALVMPVALHAQTTTSPKVIRGYYRIQNGLGYKNNSKYVIQTDMIYGAPKFSADSASRDAGSVFFIKATKVNNVYGLPEGSYRIDSLRSQGVELIGGNTDAETAQAIINHNFIDYWNSPYKDLAVESYSDDNGEDSPYKKWNKLHQQAWREAREIGYLKVFRYLVESFIYNTAVGLTTATTGYDNESVMTDDTKKNNILELTKKFNTEIADALDIDAYLIPTKLSTGETSYEIMWRPIDWKKVTDFFNKKENMDLFEYGLQAMDSYMNWIASSGESLEYNEIPLLMKLGYDLYDDINDPEGLTTGNYPAGWYRGATLGIPANGGGLRWNEGGACEIKYETIFTHPKLLYGWVKLTLYKMMVRPGTYETAIKHFGGSQLYHLLSLLGTVPPFMSYFCRYPYYDSRSTTPDWDIYLIDGFVSKNGTVTSNFQTDEMYPGDKYKDIGRFGFYARKHQVENDVDTDLDYDDYSVYKSYFDPITDAYQPLQWYPAKPTDYDTNGGTTAEEHRVYWNNWFKNTVLKTLQKGKDDPEPVSPTSHVSGGLLKTIGDGAKWVLKAVDNSDPFYVTPSSRMKGLMDGHYYTSLYVDFPIDVKKCSNGMHFYTIGNEVKTGQDAKGNEYNYVTVNEITNVVPSRQPVIVETATLDPESCKVVPANDKGKTDNTESLLKGVFFNVVKSNATPDIDRLTNFVDLSAQMEYDLNERIFGLGMEETLKNRYAIPYSADDDQLYTLQYHQADANDRNPMGFYPYKGKSLSKNKVFMIQSKSSSNAKISLGDFGGETTGISQVQNNAKVDKDVIYDLAGRRVTNPTGGIYIVNGKKVLITK